MPTATATKQSKADLIASAVARRGTTPVKPHERVIMPTASPRDPHAARRMLKNAKIDVLKQFTDSNLDAIAACEEELREVMDRLHSHTPLAARRRFQEIRQSQAERSPKKRLPLLSEQEVMERFRTVSRALQKRRAELEGPIAQLARPVALKLIDELRKIVDGIRHEEAQFSERFFSGEPFTPVSNELDLVAERVAAHFHNEATMPGSLSAYFSYLAEPKEIDAFLAARAKNLA